MDDLASEMIAGRVVVVVVYADRDEKQIQFHTCDNSI